MKKTLSLILFIFFLSGCAYAETEITFCSIPWSSNEIIAIQALNSAGLLRGNNDSIPLTHENDIYITHNDIINYQPNSLSQYKKYCYSMSFAGYTKGTIAGNPIENITLTFAYNGDYKLISAKIDLINPDYAVLKQKLTSVYGDGETTKLEDEGIESIIWKGINNSGVLLYTESSGVDCTLVYGCLNAEEILTNCLVSDPGDISGL